MSKKRKGFLNKPRIEPQPWGKEALGMRKLNSFYLILMLLGCTALIFFPSGVIADSFKVNVSQGDVNWKHGVFTLRESSLIALRVVRLICH